jgi:hypothetical protein
VSLRLLYLIFLQVLGPVLLMGRTSATKDIELLQMTNPRLRHADLLHSIELLGTGVVPLVKS